MRLISAVLALLLVSNNAYSEDGVFGEIILSPATQEQVVQALLQEPKVQNSIQHQIYEHIQNFQNEPQRFVYPHKVSLGELFDFSENLAPFETEDKSLKEIIEEWEDVELEMLSQFTIEPNIYKVRLAESDPVSLVGSHLELPFQGEAYGRPRISVEQIEFILSNPETEHVASFTLDTTSFPSMQLEENTIDAKLNVRGRFKERIGHGSQPTRFELDSVEANLKELIPDVARVYEWVDTALRESDVFPKVFQALENSDFLNETDSLLQKSFHWVEEEFQKWINEEELPLVIWWEKLPRGELRPQISLRTPKVQDGLERAKEKGDILLVAETDLDLAAEDISVSFNPAEPSIGIELLAPSELPLSLSLRYLNLQDTMAAEWLGTNTPLQWKEGEWKLETAVKFDEQFTSLSLPIERQNTVLQMGTNDMRVSLDALDGAYFQDFQLIHRNEQVAQLEPNLKTLPKQLSSQLPQLLAHLPRFFQDEDFFRRLELQFTQDIEKALSELDIDIEHDERKTQIAERANLNLRMLDFELPEGASLQCQWGELVPREELTDSRMDSSLRPEAYASLYEEEPIVAMDCELSLPQSFHLEATDIFASEFDYTSHSTKKGRIERVEATISTEQEARARVRFEMVQDPSSGRYVLLPADSNFRELMDEYSIELDIEGEISQNTWKGRLGDFLEETAIHPLRSYARKKKKESVGELIAKGRDEFEEPLVQKFHETILKVVNGSLSAHRRKAYGTWPKKPPQQWQDLLETGQFLNLQEEFEVILADFETQFRLDKAIGPQSYGEDTVRQYAEEELTRFVGEIFEPQDVNEKRDWPPNELKAFGNNQLRQYSYGFRRGLEGLALGAPLRMHDPVSEMIQTYLHEELRPEVEGEINTKLLEVLSDLQVVNQDEEERESENEEDWKFMEMTGLCPIREPGEEALSLLLFAEGFPDKYDELEQGRVGSARPEKSLPRDEIPESFGATVILEMDSLDELLRRNLLEITKRVRKAVVENSKLVNDTFELELEPALQQSESALQEISSEIRDDQTRFFYVNPHGQLTVRLGVNLNQENGILLSFDSSEAPLVLDVPLHLSLDSRGHLLEDRRSYLMEHRFDISLGGARLVEPGSGEGLFFDRVGSRLVEQASEQSFDFKTYQLFSFFENMELMLGQALTVKASDGTEALLLELRPVFFDEAQKRFEVEVNFPVGDDEN